MATRAEVRVGPGGGAATIAVVAACDWEATAPHHGFIRVVAGGTGSGNGTVTITVGPNASGGERVGELFIGSMLVPVRQPSLQLGAATVTYMHTDALGSVRLTTDATGTEVDRYHFQPFGADVPGLPATGIGQPVLFTGKERDAETAFGGGTALDYFGARYYQSQTGRFTSVDPVVPIEDALLDPQRWNRYAYALNNPLKYTDPDGRCPACLLMLQRYGSQALQLASRYGTAAYNWTTRFFNSPVGQEVSATAAEIVTGAQLPHAVALTGRALGNAREAWVAELVGGKVAGDLPIVLPGVGRTAVDVIGRSGELIGVGGPAKALNMGDLGLRLKVLVGVAEKAGVKAQYYFHKGTPLEVIRLAEKWLGKENVFEFEMLP